MKTITHDGYYIYVKEIKETRYLNPLKSFKRLFVDCWKKNDFITRRANEYFSTLLFFAHLRKVDFENEKGL